LTSRVRIAVDAMGGDFGPSVTVPACITAISKHPSLEICLFGRKKDVLTYIPNNSLPDRLSICHCDEVITMSDKPSSVLRNKKSSSMRQAIDAHVSGNFDAVVSGGNTGALMALGRMIMRTLPAIDRPAICSSVPTEKGFSYVLDMGANVDCRAEHLAQFGLMGSVLASVIENKKNPSVRLLNIGEEALKGTESVKLAATMLAQQNLNYQGYIEASEIFLGDTDVIVCDGFVGNVALKASEGVARFIAQLGREEFSGSLWAKLIAIASKPIIDRVLQRIDPENYNGAFFLGLQGVLVKSHGNASQHGFTNAIDKAVIAVRQNMIDLLEAQLELTVQN
jgi:glycerol-3-phosphate acyltransferase PlsX